MRRPHPSPDEHIPITLRLCHQLRCASMLSDDQEDWEIVAEAIDEWMRRHSPGAIPMPLSAGVHWKRLFLPDGTLLRTVYNGKSYHCRVDADAITYDGKAVSPSGFVNAVGGIRRNAWKCTWLLFPDAKEWKLADSLRSEPRSRKARKVARPVPHQPAACQSPPEAPASAAPICLAPVIDPTPAPGEAVAAPTPHNPCTPVAPPGRLPATNFNDGHSRVEALLRHPLLPLLFRMCAIDGGPPGAFNSA